MFFLGGGVATPPTPLDLPLHLQCMISPPIKITKGMGNMEIMILKIILWNNHYYLNFNVVMIARNKDEKQDYHA